MASDSYKAIVTTFDRPTLVLAGPGAGKTYLLADRVRRLLDAGVGKDNITVLTFGRDASQHMRNKLLDPEEGFGIPYADLPNVSTLHALGFEIVNRKPRTFKLRKADLRVQADEKIKQLLYRDSALLLDLSEANAETARQCKQRGHCEHGTKDPECSVCARYWDIMSRCNCIDFDDQVLFACRILENDSDLLTEFQQRSLHLLVDEYQDINAAQFRLIRLLSQNSPNGLFAVGDDAQSIYQFRGANPSFILRFATDFPGAATPPLQHSRRCHELNMRDAEQVLKKHYLDWTGPYDLEYHVEPGDEPSIWHVPDDRAEAAWVARIARRAIGEEKTVLVLVPKKEFFLRISRALHEYGVPHECPANLLPESVNRRLQVVLSLLEWVKDPENTFLTRLAIESLINHGRAKVPGAGKGKRCKPETLAKRVRIETEIAQLWEGVDRRRSMMAVLREHPSPSAAKELVRDTLNDLLGAFVNSSGEQSGEFAKQLSLASGAWTDPAKMADDLCSISDLMSTGQPTSFGAVQLMTMRKAKGLEADVVVMVGLEDDVIHNPTSSLDEEARLFYVSMTRAKEKLYLIHSYKRLRSISFGPEVTGKQRSRFLDAIGRPSKYMKAKAKTS